MKWDSVTPVMRIFDEQMAKAFYLDYLGFRLDWEHRFHDDAPLYMEISKDNLTLHLTEHYGDCTPGSSIRIAVRGLEQFHQAITEQNNKYSRPGIETTEWQTREVSLTDPFGNKLIFYERLQLDQEESVQ